MPSRNRKTTNTTKQIKTKKRSFLRRRFLKIPIWVWLVLLVIGIAGSSGDNNATSPSSTSTPTVETLASVASEDTIKTTVSIEPINTPTIEPTDNPPTAEPTATPSATPTQAPTAIPAPTATPEPTQDITSYVLKRGDKNDDVRGLQKRLIALGYLAGSADGDFGPNTEKAVIAYQKAAGLPATGECDYDTYKSLISDDAPVAPTSIPKPTKKSTANSSDGGTTYIGNKNTKKFHYAGCSSVDDMKESNKVALSSRDAAISKGYVPCKRCNP